MTDCEREKKNYIPYSITWEGKYDFKMVELRKTENQRKLAI